MDAFQFKAPHRVPLTTQGFGRTGDEHGRILSVGEGSTDRAVE